MVLLLLVFSKNNFLLTLLSLTIITSLLMILFSLSAFPTNNCLRIFSLFFFLNVPPSSVEKVLERMVFLGSEKQLLEIFILLGESAFNGVL